MATRKPHSVNYGTLSPDAPLARQWAVLEVEGIERKLADQNISGRERRALTGRASRIKSWLGKSRLTDEASRT